MLLLPFLEKFIKVQKEFFHRIQSELNFAKHSQNGINPDYDFIKDITECQYDRIGQFRLIDEQLFGKEIQYYVPWNCKDNNFEILLKLQSELMDLFKENAAKRSIRAKKKLIQIQLRRMASQIVQVRIHENQIRPLLGIDKQYFNLYLIDSNSYSFNEGIDLMGYESII